MSATQTLEPKTTGRRPRGISRGLILLLGVFVIPIALGVAFNSYGPLTVDGALRMAAATVAGQTIAILSAVTAVILTVTRRYALPAILAFIVIAMVITATAVSAIGTTGELLLDRLDLIADTAMLDH